MHKPPRKARKMALMSIFAVLLLAAALLAGVVVGGGRAASAAPAADPGPKHAQELVAQYVDLLNTGMVSGDFSHLADVYAQDATLKIAGGPFGPQGKVFTGLAANDPHAIPRLYQFLHGVIGAARWTPDAERNLSPNVVLSYEHVDFPGGGAPGHCVHMFVISGDQIASLDWIIYG